MHLFIFGAGYSGLAIGRAATARGAAVTGTTRSSDRFDALRQAGIRPCLFSGDAFSEEIKTILAQTTHLCVSAAPGAGGDPVLGAGADIIGGAMPRLQWIGYLSTIGVYGDHGGAWVDEEAECRSVKGRAAERLAAEEAWSALGRARGVPVAILRLAGIYGPGRNVFVNLEEGTARRIIRDGQVFNRIHVEDIAGAFAHLADLKADGIFNVADDEPAPPEEVISFAARLMGREPPPAIPFEAADMTPMARSFWGEVKRVSNAKLRGSGYAFRYPDYRRALTAMWQDGSWHGLHV
jgi:nucleoside-diphosphate-sugar epimerase